MVCPGKPDRIASRKIATHPDGNVLECDIRAGEEAYEVRVQTSVWLVPHISESSVVLSSWQRSVRDSASNRTLALRGQVADRRRAVPLHLYARRVCQGDEHL